MKKPVRFTKHAREVMRERNLTAAEVIEIIHSPEVVEPHKGKYRFVGNGLTVVVADETSSGVFVVVTVLLRQTKQWNNNDVCNRK